MFKFRKELLITIVAAMVYLFSGKIIFPVLKMYIESYVVSSNLSCLISAIIASIIIYASSKYYKIDHIEIDFESVNIKTLNRFMILYIVSLAFVAILALVITQITDNPIFFATNVEDDFASFSLLEKFIVVFVAAFVAPITEELIFRGAFLKTLQKDLNTIWAVLVSSAIFAVLHGVSLIVIINAFLIGIVYSYMYLTTGNLAYPIIVHFINNFVVYIKAIGFIFENLFNI